MNTDQKLKSKLMRLDLNSNDKANLWLVYKKSKPAGSISPITLEGVSEITDWIESAEMVFSLSDGFKSYDDQPPVILASYNKKITEELANILTDNSPSAAIRKGELFGCPKETLEYFAKYWDDTKKHKMIGPTELKEKFNSDEYIFVLYKVREGHEKEDSQKGLEWAKIIKKDLPELYLQVIKNHL